jgi:hypothetical protein
VAQPVTHLPTRHGVSHGGPGDGKETHKHEQVGRVVQGEGGGLPGAASSEFPHTGPQRLNDQVHT